MWQDLLWIAFSVWAIYYSLFYIVPGKRPSFLPRLITASLVIGFSIRIDYKIVQSILDDFSNGQTAIGVLLLPEALVFSIFTLVWIIQFKAYVVDGKVN